MPRRTVTTRATIALAAATLAIGLLHSTAAAESRLVTITVAGSPAVTVAGVPAVGDAPAIRRYHDSGRFADDRAIVARAARSSLLQAVQAQCASGPEECTAKRVAMIVDIDDTLLDWYPAFEKADFMLGGAARQAGVRACVTPAVAPVRALVDDAQRLGVGVLLVTGRRGPARSSTESCLRRRGITAWDALVTRTKAQDALPAATYKQQVFERLLREGWQVVLNIGDQRGDLTGTAETARFLLPNPLYRTR